MLGVFLLVGINLYFPGFANGSALSSSHTADENCLLTISDFYPRQGPVGTFVTITGSGFTAATSLKFNNQTAEEFSVISDNEIKARVPSGAMSGPLFIITSDCKIFSTSSFSVLSTFGSNGAADLFISAVVEGSSYNKAVAIANFTGSAVNLGDYAIEVYYNGSSVQSNPVKLDPVSLENNQVWVVVDFQAIDQLEVYADQKKPTITWFNGNDAIVLSKNGIPVDIFGNIGCDPGGGWEDGSHSTLNKTLIRKPHVNSGITQNPGNADVCDFPTLVSEWYVHPVDTYYPIRSHIVDYNPAIPQITAHPSDIGICPEADVAFSVAATNATWYQWKQLVGRSWVDLVGATGAILSLSADELNHGDMFYCEVGNSNGWAASNAVILSFSPDVEAPILILPQQTLEFCVENISEARFDEETMDVVTNNPDWHILRSTELDVPTVNFSDVCCAAETLTLQWKIVFSNGSTFPEEGQLMDGQPSEYFSTLPEGFKLPGHAVDDIEHSIFYRLQDCNNNVGEMQEARIVILSRPQLSKR